MKTVPIDEELEEHIGFNLMRTSPGSNNNPYQIQVNEVTIDGKNNITDKREQLVYFPKIRPNPRDLML